MKETILNKIPMLNGIKIPQPCKVCDFCMVGYYNYSDDKPSEIFCNIGKDIMKDGGNCERKINPIVIAYKLKG